MPHGCEDSGPRSNQQTIQQSRVQAAAPCRRPGKEAPRCPRGRRRRAAYGGPNCKPSRKGVVGNASSSSGTSRMRGCSGRTGSARRWTISRSARSLPRKGDDFALRSGARRMDPGWFWVRQNFRRRWRTPRATLSRLIFPPTRRPRAILPASCRRVEVLDRRVQIF